MRRGPEVQNSMSRTRSSSGSVSSAAVPDGVVLPALALAAVAVQSLSVEQSLVLAQRPDHTCSHAHLAEHAGRVHLYRAGTGALGAQTWNTQTAVTAATAPACCLWQPRKPITRMLRERTWHPLLVTQRQYSCCGTFTQALRETPASQGQTCLQVEVSIGPDDPGRVIAQSDEGRLLHSFVPMTFSFNGNFSTCKRRQALLFHLPQQIT